MSGYRNPTRVAQRMGRINPVSVASDRGDDRSRSRELYEDFTEVSTTTLPAWLVTADTSAAGSPVLDYVDDAVNGQFQLLTAADDEVETLTLYQGDQLTIDPTANTTLEIRIAIDADTLPLSADERLVWGLASARDATLDDVVDHAWFRIEGASNNILWETDDGTTDDDDNDTGQDIADNTFITTRVELLEGQAVFSILVGGVWTKVGAGDISASAATDLLQIFIEFQKDGGTETEDVRIDYIYLNAGRSD